ncbi:MAG: diguanylate cyclase [Rubrivivax sp.]|nr:diguanylate cyclase [Rubrivivax sp.]
MSSATPALIAKGALRRLALAQQEPTPENYARAYAEESGQAAAVLPERARPALERLASRWPDDAARRDELVGALMQGRWERATPLLEQMVQAAVAQSQGMASLIERLVRMLPRASRQWSAGRRADSLQRVLDGSRSDLGRLQQRLSALVGAWESDSPLAPVEGEAPEPPPAADWPAALEPLHQTLCVGLGDRGPQARQLADRLGQLADALAAEGPRPATLASLGEVCLEVQALLGQRHRLVDDLHALCLELGRGLEELAEDGSWARGQAQALQARLAGEPSGRGVRAAAELLAETRNRHARVRAEREQARQALQQLLQQLLDEIGELGLHTGRFTERVDRHAVAIAAADSLEGLAEVVRELLEDSRAVHDQVRQAQERLAGEHARARELESRVRALEAELRELSDEVATDALTQVANRRGLAQAFAVEAARREREGAAAPLSVGLIDIDNFKRLNDTLGHAAGDKALQSLAVAVRERLRPVDHLARFGGEEFVVLLPGTGRDEAQQALTRLQRSLSAALFLHENQEVFVTFSAGVTEWQPGETLESALERADQALYEAKRTGKNRTCMA